MSDVLTREPWQVDAADFPADGPVDEQATFLVRYAVLAPSSHNSQPWAFAVDGATVDVHRDDDRWLSVADADRRELHVSVGCALANLLVAARHFGFDHDVTSLPDGPESLVARVTLRADGGGMANDGDRAAQLSVGRSFERLALAATAAGVAVHPVSQTLEVPALRAALGDLLDLQGGVPQHLVRLGYADGDGDHTPRRPVEAVLR